MVDFLNEANTKPQKLFRMTGDTKQVSGILYSKILFFHDNASWMDGDFRSPSIQPRSSVK